MCLRPDRRDAGFSPSRARRPFRTSTPPLFQGPVASLVCQRGLLPAACPELALIPAGRRAAGLEVPDESVGFRIGPPDPAHCSVPAQAPACRSGLDLIFIYYNLRIKTTTTQHTSGERNESWEEREASKCPPALIFPSHLCSFVRITKPQRLFHLGRQRIGTFPQPRNATFMVLFVSLLWILNGAEQNSSAELARRLGLIVLWFK